MRALPSAERLACLIVGVLMLLVALRGQFGPTPIIWPSFTSKLLMPLAFLVTGLALRLFTANARSAAVLVAMGLYPLFATALSLACYLAFPLSRPLIDEQLMALDALFFDWGAAVARMAEYPTLSALLRWVYLSSLFQLLALLLWLGATGRVARLQALQLTGMLAGCMTLAFWLIWPSFGPSAHIALAPGTEAAANLLVTNAYGAHLMHLAEHGVARIENHLLLGTVAFPSFHIVMAFMAVAFSRGTLLFWPLVVLNLLMVPATLVHGGHYAVDLLGGAVVFALALHLVGRLMAGSATEPAPAPVPAPGSEIAAHEKPGILGGAAQGAGLVHRLLPFRLRV